MRLLPCIFALTLLTACGTKTPLTLPPPPAPPATKPAVSPAPTFAPAAAPGKAIDDNNKASAEPRS